MKRDNLGGVSLTKQVKDKEVINLENQQVQNDLPQQNEMENSKTTKTKKALRKLKKREQLEHKKNTLPAPKKVQYTIHAESESIIIKGEIPGYNAKKATSYCAIRFKLSGQKEFLEFGYQAKVPLIKNQFQFEVLESALLDKDSIAIQLYNDAGQCSEIVFCAYERACAPVEGKFGDTEDPLSRFKKSQQLGSGNRSV